MKYLLLPLLFSGVVLSTDAQVAAPTVSRAIPDETLAPAGAAMSLNLSGYFTVTNATGQIVRFDTVLGKFDVALRPDAAPQEVANFLGYVQRGDYSSTFFHRSAALNGGPVSIVQGGGYQVTSAGIVTIPEQAPVPLEYKLPNARGTIAAARTSDPNSATSQWYFNVQDNGSALGPAIGGGYTVFGSVIGAGMSVVDAIAALPRVNAGAPFDQLPVRDYTSGSVQEANLVVVNSITQLPLYPDASGNGALAFAARSSADGIVAAAISGSTLTLTPGAAGTATVTVTASDLNGDSIDDTFTVTVTSVLPSITVQPKPLAVAVGNTAVFSAGAANASAFQWQHDGTDIAGATDAMLVVSNASAASAGGYTLIARSTVGFATSDAATLTVANPAPADIGRLINLSIRGQAGTGSNTLIVGFAVGGENAAGSEPLLLRGVGPSLAQFGITGYLPDPVATLYSGSTVVASNDNWGGDPVVSDRAKQVNAFPLSSASSLDAALAVSPAVGDYTMEITGNGTAEGAALAEIYDSTDSAAITSTTPRLVNLSARTFAGGGDNTLIAGFVVGGSTARTVLIRGIGPGLVQFGLSGVLADPKLTVTPLNSTSVVAENDNWGGQPEVVSAAASVGAFPLTNGASTDSAVLVTLPPGAYSAQVTGADGGTGVALVEVYEVP